MRCLKFLKERRAQAEARALGYRFQNKTKEAIRQLQHSLDLNIALHGNFKEEVASAYEALGSAYETDQNIEAAFYAYLQAKDIYQLLETKEAREKRDSLQTRLKIFIQTHQQTLRKAKQEKIAAEDENILLEKLI